jgi:hypothetical protein
VKSVERTLAEARKAVKDEPTRWGAAVYEGDATPLNENPATKVRLFVHVKTAEEQIRERVKELIESGFKRGRFGVSHGLVQLIRGDDVVWLGLDKRRR